MSELWLRIKAMQVRDLAIVGVSKHAGKTTVLQHLLVDADPAEGSLAVASVGIDGERFDSILGIPKPAIRVPKGTLIATAIDVMHHGHAAMRWLEPTGISSPLGEVWIGAALTEGTVVLAGVRQRAHLLQVKRRFHDLGAARVLFDGALSRMVAVDPEVADGVILAVGAVVGTVADVARVTRQTLRRIQIAAVTGDALAHFVREYGTVDGTGIVIAVATMHSESDWSDASIDHVQVYRQESAFTADIRSAGEPSESARIFFYRGAVTDQVIRSLQACVTPTLVIARDAAHVFVTEEVWRAFLRAGRQLQVARRVPLIAVTINPSAPGGRGIDRLVLRAAIETLVEEPVIDVIGD